MKKLIIIALFITSYMIETRAVSNDYYTLIDSAECYIKNKQWERAEFFLMKVLRNYPDDNNNSLIICNLATVQRYQGKYDEAIKNYSFAINMTPNAVTLLKNRASLYLEIDSLRNARDDYERVLYIDEKDEETRYYHGILSIRLNEMDIAKNDFDYILYHNPTSGLGKEGLALWYKERSDYIDAIKCYSEVIKERPTSILLSNRAECYLALKQLNDATEDIRKAIEMSPDDGYLYVLRAKLNKARFNTDDMKRDLKLAESLGYDSELAEQILNSEK